MVVIAVAPTACLQKVVWEKLVSSNCLKLFVVLKLVRSLIGCLLLASTNPREDCDSPRVQSCDSQYNVRSACLDCLVRAI